MDRSCCFFSGSLVCQQKSNSDKLHWTLKCLPWTYVDKRISWHHEPSLNKERDTKTHKHKMSSLDTHYVMHCVNDSYELIIQYNWWGFVYWTPLLPWAMGFCGRRRVGIQGALAFLFHKVAATWPNEKWAQWPQLSGKCVPRCISWHLCRCVRLQMAGKRDAEMDERMQEESGEREREKQMRTEGERGKRRGEGEVVTRSCLLLTLRPWWRAGKRQALSTRPSFVA